MALEAKRAAKLEKKLKTLLGGYQVSKILITYTDKKNRFIL